MKCNVKNRLMDEQIRKNREQTGLEIMAYLNYAARLMYLSLRENAGFGADRMHRFCENSQQLTQEYIDFYTADNAPDYDYAIDSYFGMRRDLLAIGFDPETEFWCDNPFGDGDFPSPAVASREREYRKIRLNYANVLSFYARELYCGYAIELHQTNGFGATRLRKVFATPIQRYLQTMRLYLLEDATTIKQELRNTLDACNELGYFAFKTKIY